MTTINLRDYYPFYEHDIFVEVPDELAAELIQWKLDEKARRRKMYRYMAQYSLDRGDGIEHNLLFAPLSTEDLFERKTTNEQLYRAIATLPDKQAKRIYAHYFMGMSKAAIARAEGVVKSTVSESIERGLRGMEKYLKDIL